jgi:hypothetical protein
MISDIKQNQELYSENKELPYLDQIIEMAAEIDFTEADENMK